jgi:DNA repair exonuclease SbcCD nuclease subunit
VKILQTADNHLGETAYSRIDPSTGLNARGLDFLNSFQRILEVASKERVDVLLVVGDFFTRVNPHPRYLLEVMKGIKKLSKANVITIFVSGNHETPKTITTVNPLSLLGQLDNVHVVLEPTSIEINGIDFVCVPAPPAFDEIKNLFNPLLQKALMDSKSDRKILAAHLPLGQATTSSERTLESFIGECVDIEQIPNKFLYAALGHMHRFQQLGQEVMPIVYSGSSERCEWAEEHDDKFAVLVEIEDKVEITPIKLPVRDMITIIDQDCSGLSAMRINKLVLEAIESNKQKIESALVRIKLDNIDIEEYRLIDWNTIKQTLNEYGVFDYKLQPQTVISLPVQAGPRGEYIFPPSKELELYVKSKKEYNRMAPQLLKLGKEIIDEAKEMMQSET